MSSLKFRVLIDTDSSEEIFRDIIISSADNFESFYKEILRSFGFRGDQLASFYLSNDSWDKGLEIALMDMSMGEEPDSPSIMKETCISDMMESKNQKLIFVYDFLKMWCFLIELIEETPEFTIDPKVVFSVGKAPLEDSREVDLSPEMGMGSSADLGNDIDDIFSDLDEGDDFSEFENLDDYDI